MSGQYIQSPLYTLKVAKSHPAVSKPLFSVVVSAKVAKKAVFRNQVKRRIRSILSDLRPILPPQVVILVMTKPGVITASFPVLKESLVKSLQNSGIVSV